MTIATRYSPRFTQRSLLQRIVALPTRAMRCSLSLSQCMLSIIAVATARNRSMHASIIDDNSMTCNDSHVVDALMMSMMFNDVTLH